VERSDDLQRQVGWCEDVLDQASRPVDFDLECDRVNGLDRTYETCSVARRDGMAHTMVSAVNQVFRCEGMFDQVGEAGFRIPWVLPFDVQLV